MIEAATPLFLSISRVLGRMFPGLCLIIRMEEQPAIYPG